MNHRRILSGDQLIDKGITKINGALPELGLKDVVPNGSWLEQKQIQAALEARKHVVEVERIEKSHVLSHANWRDDLLLAEVTQKVGGYWQHMGHNVGKQLYLLPEEALHLMETNCLLLKHNEVTVSLQKAYSLLLRDTITILQYKVYAFLSRQGYKVIRHKYNVEVTRSKENENIETSQDKIIEKNLKTQQDNNLNEIVKAVQKQNITSEDDKALEVENIKNECIKTTQESDNKGINPESEKLDEVNSLDHVETEQMNVNDDINLNDKQSEHIENQTQDTEGVSMDSNEKKHTLDTGTKTSDADMLKFYQQKPTSSRNTQTKQILLAPICYMSKLQKLKNRQNPPCDSKNLQKFLEVIPDFTKDTVTINAPEEDHIPRNIYLNNTAYTLKVDNIRSKGTANNHSARRTYCISDNEVSGAHVRRVKEAFNRNTGVFPGHYNQYFVRQQPQLRPFSFWRPPQTNVNFFPLHMIFQRHFAPNANLIHRHFLPRNMPRHFRPNPCITNLNETEENVNRKRAKETRSAQQNSFNNIKKLAARLKQMILLRNVDQQNIIALHRVLHAYNTTYKAKLRLTNNFDIIDDVETVTLEDDDETKTKKPRLASDENLSSYGDNLNRLKQIAAKLKVLGDIDTSTRHKRAMSNAIKTFNKSYKADVYMNSSFEIIDRRQIILDSSSDSDCAVEVPLKKSKKLRNPFNVLKQLSDKSRSIASTSKEAQSATIAATSVIENKKYSEKLLKIFTSDWLPPVEDFGRAEIYRHSAQQLFNVKREEFILEFIENHPMVFNNWCEAKIAFYENLEASHEQCKISQNFEDNSEVSELGIKPLISPKDGTDMESILNKLSIIKNCKDVQESSLKIDFDVYNRDIQDFRKTKPPVPHFMIVCLSDTSDFPSAADVTSLHSKYDDNVTILFAIVGTSSISFIQINPSDLPVYLPSSDIDMP